MLYLNSLKFGDSIANNTKLIELTFNTNTDVIHGFKEIELHCNNSNFTTLNLSRCLFLETLDLSNCTNLNNASGIDNWNILSSANFTEMFKDSNVHPNFTRVVGTWDSDGTFTPS